MTIVEFNGKEYDYEAIQKLIFSCHSEEVLVSEIVPSQFPEAERAIAIKFNNKYQLLIGSIITTKEKIKLNCITKHALKRCELVEEVEPPPVNAIQSAFRDSNYQGKFPSKNSQHASRRFNKSYQPQ